MALSANAATRQMTTHCQTASRFLGGLVASGTDYWFHCFRAVAQQASSGRRPSSRLARGGLVTRFSSMGVALARVGEEWGDGDGEAECVDDEARVAGIDGVRAGGGDGVAGGGIGNEAAEAWIEAREAHRARMRGARLSGTARGSWGGASLKRAGQVCGWAGSNALGGLERAMLTRGGPEARAPTCTLL